MISAQQIKDILSLYAKFGWNLKSVLLSPKLKNNLGDSVGKLFDSVEVIESEIDAAWFSRASGKDKTAWELRGLRPTPFALCEVFANDEDESICDEKRGEMILQLKAKK